MVVGSLDMRKNLILCRMFLSYRYNKPPSAQGISTTFPSHSPFSRLHRQWLVNTLADKISFQRNLNNAFAYDLVPSPSVITAALKAARRVNDFPTAVRIFEGMTAHFSLPLFLPFPPPPPPFSSLPGNHKPELHIPTPLNFPTNKNPPQA